MGKVLHSWRVHGFTGKKARHFNKRKNAYAYAERMAPAGKNPESYVYRMTWYPEENQWRRNDE